jgi:hypothetical protein
MATNPKKFRRRPGRPTKAEELQRALAEIGCDPALIDPRRVLAAIAADADAPATARVAAAKALLAARDPAEMKPSRGKARPSKKVRAQRAAAHAGGRGSRWGEDLAWRDGHPPQ